MPSQPKSLQKKQLQENCFGTVILQTFQNHPFTRQINSRGVFSCKQGQTSGSNIAKRMLWWNNFVIISARMVRFRVRFQAVKVPTFGEFPVENPTNKATASKLL